MRRKGRALMNEDHELSRLEKEWKNSFERFIAPEPSREQTLNLIREIKETDENKPVDMRATLEAQQETQSFHQKWPVCFYPNGIITAHVAGFLQELYYLF